MVLTGRPEYPPASDPSGSSVSPQCQSAGPSSALRDSSRRLPDGKAELTSTAGKGHPETRAVLGQAAGGTFS